MRKKEIDEILMINWYLVEKKFKNPNSPIVRNARVYLTEKIDNLVKKRFNNQYTKY